MNSSMLMGSACSKLCSDDLRNWAMPLGALSDVVESLDTGAERSSLRRPAGQRSQLQAHPRVSASSYLLSSSNCFLRRFWCIMRHVRFSMRC